jgi:hypothetical protein
MIDAAHLGVGRDKLVRKLRDGFHKAKTNMKARRGQAAKFYKEARKPGKIKKKFLASWPPH